MAFLNSSTHVIASVKFCALIIINFGVGKIRRNASFDSDWSGCSVSYDVNLVEFIEEIQLRN